jgi:hypothetical protein
VPSFQLSSSVSLPQPATYPTHPPNRLTPSCACRWDSSLQPYSVVLGCWPGSRPWSVTFQLGPRTSSSR